MSHILGRSIQVRGFAQGSLRFFCASKVKLCSPPAETAFKTSETNPVNFTGNHTKDDIGLIFGLKNSYGIHGLFKGKYILKKNYREECTTFNETYLMIRKPALEIVHYLKNANYDDPINKYVIYGKYGAGKSMTLLNIIHYAHLSGWLIVYVPYVMGFLTQPTERTPSRNDENLIDLPTLGSGWLLNFKSQNLGLLNNLDLRIQNDYLWGTYMESKKGDTLLSVLDHGICHAKYSSEVILAVLKEIKLWSKNKKVKTLVAIDPYSILFTPGRKCRNKKMKFLSPDQVSFLEGFKNMAKSDWHNGAAVLVCHAEKNSRNDLDHLPLTQLTIKGFEFLDPFIPIHVPPLTNREMESLLAYYRSKKWLLHSRGDTELKLVSCGNFEYLESLCQFA